MKTRKFLSMLIALAIAASFISVPSFAEETAGSRSDLVVVPYTVTFQGTVSTGNAETVKSAIGTKVSLDIAYEETALLVDDDNSLGNSVTGIVSSFASVEAFSIGGKWKAGAPKPKDILSLINKGGVLQLTNSFDTKTKKPSAGKAQVGTAATEATDDVAAVPASDNYEAAVPAAVILTFAKIEARPKGEKLAVNYDKALANGEVSAVTVSDASGKTNGKWILTTKDGKAPKAGYSNIQYVVPADGKKLADTDTFGSFPSSGIAVKDMADGKAAKTVYFVRTKAYTEGNGNSAKYYPATKPYKVTATSVTKAPSLKADYKNETLKLKFPINVYCGPLSDLTSDSGKTVSGNTVTAGDTGFAATHQKFIIPATKEDAKKPVLLKDYLSASTEKSITVWISATAKKPASMKQSITLAKRAAAPTEAFEVSNGKVAKVKEWESRVKETDKWGGFPKMEKAGEISVRVKNTAKATKEGGYEGLAASAPSTYTVAWGVINPDAETAKQKQGITGATKKPS